MSIRSLAALAAARDKARPGKVAGGGGREVAIAPPEGAGREVDAGAPPEKGGIPQQFTDVLISAIPTEPLAAYTALVGVAIAALSRPEDRAYLPFRWWAYGFFLVIIVMSIWLAYVRVSPPAPAEKPAGPAGPAAGNRRPFPVAEALAALVAGGAWGLVMPGSPLNAQLTGTARTLAVAAITIGAATVLTAVQAPVLKTGSKTPGDAAATDKPRK